MEQYSEIKHLSFANACNKFTVQNGEREFVATITTDQVDRDGDRVDPAGIDLANFKTNPVILFNHDRFELPIGKASWIKRFSGDEGNGIVAKGVISEKTEKANDVFNLMQEGILSKVSIGFGVKQMREPTEDETKSSPALRRVITKSELFEFSVVGLPSNTGANIEAVSKVPAWLRGAVLEDEDLIDPAVDLADMAVPVKLYDPVALETLVQLTDAPMSREEIAAQATKDGIELYEVRVLGRVT